MKEKELINEGRFEIIVKRYVDGTQLLTHNDGLRDHEILAICEVLKQESITKMMFSKNRAESEEFENQER